MSDPGAPERGFRAALRWLGHGLLSLPPSAVVVLVAGWSYLMYWAMTLPGEAFDGSLLDHDRDRALLRALADFPAVVSSAAELRGELSAQIVAPVQWLLGARALVNLGVSHIIEFGHGNVLTRMLRRTLQHVVLENVSDTASATRTAERVRSA